MDGTVRTRGGGVVKGQEDLKYPDREPEYIQTTFSMLHTGGECSLNYVGHVNIENLDLFYEDVKDLTPFYLVVVRYTTGDTFGATYGSTCIPAAYLDMESAELTRRNIINEKYKNRENIRNEWEGHFESLESAEVICMLLHKNGFDPENQEI